MPRPVLTPEEMKAAEQAVFDSGVDSFEVMRRAGLAVAEFLHANFPQGRIQVLCGPGGNGGDGFIAAAHLQRQWRDVEVFSTLAPEELRGDPAKAAAEWNGPVRSLEEALTAPHDIVLDGLFGGGLSGPLDGGAAQLAARNSPVVAIDVPSGLDGLTGQPLGTCFKAAATVTFAALRPAHVLAPGLAFSGQVVAMDIGVPAQSSVFENSPALWIAQLPQPGLEGHKHKRGHLKVVSGGPANTGAARLAARAGLRAGAGLVTVLSPPAAVIVNASHLTAEMLVSLNSPDTFAEACDSASAVVLGPAAGVNEATGEHVGILLDSPARAVLDADALSVVAMRDKLFAKLRPNDLLTPHIGEFNRLFPGLLDQSINKIEAVREAAKRAGCVVLLKGPDTVIAAPDGAAVVNTHATPWLATAGTGDVLAGTAGGFVAQGVDPLPAAAMASWIHGEAGRRIGPGLLASDLESYMPGILKDLHAAR